MQQKIIRFSSASVEFFFDARFSILRQLADQKNTVIITDENVFSFHQKKFRGWNTIVLKAGEAFKVQPTVDAIMEQLIEMKADRSTTLIGVGGGVVTDITGYVASVYMRGIRFGFVPTTLLCMVDASIGGKNGIDVGVYKNLVGTIRQPSFILHDLSFLKTLPETEWQNGFAEIIKHAAIKNAALFRELEQKEISFYRKSKKALALLVQKNALLKTKVVQQDEFETGERKLLNFGHTIGHALENQYQLSHGQAISIGMTRTAEISTAITGFRQSARLISLLDQYGLPTQVPFDKQKMMNVLKMDKKKQQGQINFICLEKIGKAVIHKISFDELNQLLA